MRFVLGLIVGVAGVLFVAATLPAQENTAPPVANAMVKATEAQIFVPPESQSEPKPEPKPEPEPELDPEVEPELEQLLNAPAPGSLATATEPESASVVSAAEVAADGPTNAEPAATMESVATSDTSEKLEPDSGQLSVWHPFHSEASAEGFARRLSTQLGHPFSVLRVAAAEYHVVFDYADHSERELLQRQVAVVTGRQP